MSDLMTFLTSSEMITVCIIGGGIAMLAMFSYLSSKTYDYRKKKHNTKALNMLVEQDESIEIVTEKEVEPIKETSYLKVEKPITKKEEHTFETPKPVVTVEPVMPIPEVKAEEKIVKVTEEEISDPSANVVIEEASLPVEKQEEVKEEIHYESIEPEPVVAQAELEKLTEELKKAEQTVQNISLTEFETEQEENAIISLDELLAKGNTLYEQNEITQYQDEGNEPISLEDLEIRKQEMKKQEATATQPIQKEEPKVIEEKKLSEAHKVESIKAKAYKAKTEFKNSPFISPIYGIEGRPKVVKQTELELENTATMQKLDEEIRKTNEFIITLKELQKNLDS